MLNWQKEAVKQFQTERLDGFFLKGHFIFLFAAITFLRQSEETPNYQIENAPIDSTQSYRTKIIFEVLTFALIQKNIFLSWTY